MTHEFLQSDRIRVLVNGIHAKSGGGVTYIRNLLPLLANDDDLELHLFLHRDQFSLFGPLDERVRIHLLDFPNGFFANLAWEQLALPVLAKVMAVDVTVSPANYGPLVASAPIIMLRNSLAVAGKETRLGKRLYWAGLTIMTALSLLTCRRAIAVSHYARRALTFGVGKRLQRKITVIPHGVSDVFSPAETPRTGTYLLAVSDIYVQKNLHTLISALALVHNTFPGVVLKVAGRAIDEDYLAELKAQIVAEGLEEAVAFLGACDTDQLLELYRNCRIFVFPSTVETFGNPLVEAMACGAPIASSSSAAMPEILGDAAVFFDPLNAADIAERIVTLLNDEPARGRLSANALARARRYSWRETARLTAEVIKSVVPERRRRRALSEGPVPSSSGAAS